MRIADRIALHMREQGTEWIMWGDGSLVDAAHGHVKANHPLDVMRAACDAMDRAPDLFEKHTIRGMDSRARDRLVRGYRLKNGGEPCS